MRSLILILMLGGCSETGVSALVDEGPAPVDEDPAPAWTVEPTDIVFESIAAGERATSLFTVTNNGDAPLEVLDVSFAQDAPIFGFQALDGTTVQPGASADWSVSYAPQTASSEGHAATVVLQSNDPESPEARVQLSGVTLLPALQLSPTTHDFGVVDVGDSASIALTVSNPSDAPGTLQELRFTPSSPELALEPSALDSLPLTLPPGASEDLEITYTPTDEPGDEATLEILTDAPDTPSLVANVQGEGFAPEREVEIFLTADDAWTGYLDGVEITATNQSDWQRGDTLSWSLGPGKHVIAIQASDVGSVISGFIAVVKVDGAIVSRTGEGDWIMTDSAPGSGWETVAFDDSSWTTAVQCANPSTWGTYWPRDFYAEDAKWVWWTSACRDLRQAWFRFTLEL